MDEWMAGRLVDCLLGWIKCWFVVGWMDGWLVGLMDK